MYNMLLLSWMETKCMWYFIVTAPYVCIKPGTANNWDSTGGLISGHPNQTNITNIGAYHRQCVDQSSIFYSYKILNTMSREKPSLRRVTRNCRMTHISKLRGRQLRTRDVVMRDKNLFALLASLRGQNFTNKKTLYIKVFVVKMTGNNETTIPRWDQHEDYGSKPRGSGLIRPGLFEPTNVKHILNRCRTTSLKNSNVFFIETLVLGKDLVSLIPNTTIVPY